MQKVSYSELVMIVRYFLEKQIGLKNLSHCDISEIGNFEFGIHTMKFAIYLDTISVYRITGFDDKLMLSNDSTSLLIQKRLREHVAQKLGVAL